MPRKKGTPRHIPGKGAMPTTSTSSSSSSSGSTRGPEKSGSVLDADLVTRYSSKSCGVDCLKGRFGERFVDINCSITSVTVNACGLEFQSILKPGKRTAEERPDGQGTSGESPGKHLDSTTSDCSCKSSAPEIGAYVSTKDTICKVLRKPSDDQELPIYSLPIMSYFKRGCEFPLMSVANPWIPKDKPPFAHIKMVICYNIASDTPSDHAKNWLIMDDKRHIQQIRWLSPLHTMTQDERTTVLCLRDHRGVLLGQYLTFMRISEGNLLVNSIYLTTPTG